MLHYLLDERQLNVWRILHNKLLASLARMDDYGVVSEYAEAELPTIANEFDAVCAGTFVAYEAPRAASWQP
jgi:hypothetical protein